MSLVAYLACVGLVPGLGVQDASIVRDSYGVPHISAPSLERAFYYQGYAVAEDRLWQLENARLLSRGKMAEHFGPEYVRSDREILQTGYTQEEIQAQLDGMGSLAKSAFRAYADGVNAYLDSAQKEGKLPPGYATHGFRPAPWTEVDSAAIAIRMMQLFGGGGAGELRNFALLQYLQTQPCKERTLDVFDDFAWPNDPAAIPTVSPHDDPIRGAAPSFPNPSRKQTESQLSSIPTVGLFELLPAIRMAELSQNKAIAAAAGVSFKAGSYAVVVDGTRSATGRPLLLSAPQMGFTTPSVIHEVSLSAPGYRVAGMDVPGIPGIVIGTNDNLAWGLTSGVADLEDVVWNRMPEPGTYEVDGQRKPLTEIRFTIKVKGESDQTVVQRRTEFGPVLVASQVAKCVFSRKRSYWMKELDSGQNMIEFGLSRSRADLDRLASRVAVSFNLFFATNRGEIGWRYCGKAPIRAGWLDPRLPAEGGRSSAWSGFISWERMPRVDSPRTGLIANWNNKPAAWWHNGDTPVWGRIFRNHELLAGLEARRLSVTDLEMAAWRIARRDETYRYFAPWADRAASGKGHSKVEEEAARLLRSFSGWTLDGSQGAAIYQAWLRALREELFAGAVGNLVSPDLFEAAIQPSLLLKAIEGKTKYPFLGKRNPAEVAQNALQKAVSKLAQQRGDQPGRWFYAANGIAVPDQPRIPYSNRGSYIQITELADVPVARNVLTPGVAESGAHSLDQVHLARAWTYKPMSWR